MFLSRYLHDDEVTVGGLEEVVVSLHLDLHLVLHPVDLQRVGLSNSANNELLVNNISISYQQH